MYSFEIEGPRGTFNCESVELEDEDYFTTQCSNEYVEMYGFLDINYDDDYCSASYLSLTGSS
jgi:hypothetical protein